MVGRADDVRVVLDRDDGIAARREALENAEKPVRVARMEADRGLVEDVERAGEGVADRRSELDPLGLAARERAHRACEREIPEADLDERFDAAPEILDERRPPRAFLRAQGERRPERRAARRA